MSYTYQGEKIPFYMEDLCRFPQSPKAHYLHLAATRSVSPCSVIIHVVIPVLTPSLGWKLVRSWGEPSASSIFPRGSVHGLVQQSVDTCRIGGGLTISWSTGCWHILSFYFPATSLPLSMTCSEFMCCEALEGRVWGLQASFLSSVSF